MSTLTKALIGGGAFVLLALFVAGIVVLALRISGDAEGVAVAATPATPPPIITEHETIVCGPFGDPIAVAGVPVAFDETTLSFQDDYVLQLTAIPSMYLNRYALFQVEGTAAVTGSEPSEATRSIARYAVVSDPDFHPCPPQQAAP